MAQTIDKALICMVRSEGLEPPTPWFEARHSKYNPLIYINIIVADAHYKCSIVYNDVGLIPTKSPQGFLKLCIV